MIEGRQLIIERQFNRADLLAIVGELSEAAVHCLDAAFSIMKYDGRVFDALNSACGVKDVFEKFSDALDSVMRAHATNYVRSAFASKPMAYADCAREMFRQMTGGVVLCYDDFKRSRLYAEAACA